MDNLVELIQALEFFDWLRVHEPTIRIPGNISSKRLKKLVLEFCKEEGYLNGRMLSEEVNRWLMGKGPVQIIDQIAEYLKSSSRSRLSSCQFNQHNPFDRYGAVRFHALFLFRASDCLRNSIEKEHWLDLHELTGDDLDIYFTKNDLKERTTGYKVINGLKKLKLSVDILPALLLWEDHIEINTIIPLEGLDPGSVIRVMEEIVQTIEEGCTIETISQRGESCSIELRKAREDEIRTKKGDNTIYNNYGSGCIVGSHGNSKNVMVNVNNNENLLNKMLTPDDIIVIKDLKNALMTKEIEEIEESKRIEGALYLAKIAKATNKEGQEENLAGWNRWLGSLGERGQKALSVLANTMTIAIPIATLLGIYPS
ncbi:hypothetical protein [Methanosarcina barkeri]|nr:hypothetical protein [Methanosarcina barkeri]